MRCAYFVFDEVAADTQVNLIERAANAISQDRAATHFGFKLDHLVVGAVTFAARAIRGALVFSNIHVSGRWRWPACQSRRRGMACVA